MQALYMVAFSLYNRFRNKRSASLLLLHSVMLLAVINFGGFHLNRQ